MKLNIQRSSILRRDYSWSVGCAKPQAEDRVLQPALKTRCNFESLNRVGSVSTFTHLVLHQQSFAKHYTSLWNNHPKSLFKQRKTKTINSTLFKKKKKKSNQEISSPNIIYRYGSIFKNVFLQFQMQIPITHLRTWPPTVQAESV